MSPYYESDGIVLWHADCLEAVAEWTRGDVLVTDPPFGISWESGHFGKLARSIRGDEDVSVRDAALAAWGDKPALVFGSWRRPRPNGTKMLLVWDTKGALGMGDLTLPWKPAHQEIYVLGTGFLGTRTSDVLSFAPVQAMADNGRLPPRPAHPYRTIEPSAAPGRRHPMSPERIQALCLLPGYLLFWCWLVREVVRLYREERLVRKNQARAAFYAIHGERLEYQRWINEQL